MDALTRFDARFGALDGEFSVWCGRPGKPPVYTLEPDRLHYPASTMKIGVMAAAYRLADAGKLDLDEHIAVHNEFTSAVGGGFAMDPEYDSDAEVWQYQGASASVRWLIRRMIVRSSNLATNLVLDKVGYAAAQEAYRAAGATRSITRRGIEDYAARDAGVDNEITAADLAAQLSAIQLGRLASPASCAEMLDVLAAQEFQVDFARGLPEGTRIALKNGWIDGVRHSAALVYPDDTEPYALVACATSPLATSQEGDDEVCRIFAELSAAVWQRRADLG
ncbi:serine hydrolase [Stackebrandtia nassauensis]|uniref:Beta-lactamase class A-like protein n=1 Tax=Stackebrandtia nassauensis (strain DSM 44728 / CIP 108903 / NRRL B-16338 / NBRC 102104 / LLR-40K-21) TaxID=446470 RepID=D3QAB1_STANL|nr:serine hydrolase [Stackebrandtia nassauensis]ADD42694.1 Beta-lactamase class A-like protein [Stackebrandtia nassauensis DSM 44728]